MKGLIFEILLGFIAPILAMNACACGRSSNCDVIGIQSTFNLTFLHTSGLYGTQLPVTTGSDSIYFNVIWFLFYKL